MRDDVSPSMTGDGKYLALKEPRSQAEANHIEDLWLAPGTFFVLRSSDAFAIPTLYAYASSIQTHIELNRENLSSEKIASLEETSHYAFALAQEWQRRGDGRLPD